MLEGNMLLKKGLLDLSINGEKKSILARPADTLLAFSVINWDLPV